MSQAKRMIDERDYLRSVAGDLLVRVGAGKRCDIHEDIIETQFDSEAESRAYAVGTNMVKAGEVDCDRESFMDAIKDAIDNMSDGCPSCEHYLHDDD
jgi:hypothetical protein